jgi:hypothetical protein
MAHFDRAGPLQMFPPLGAAAYSGSIRGLEIDILYYMDACRGVSDHFNPMTIRIGNVAFHRFNSAFGLPHYEVLQ